MGRTFMKQFLQKLSETRCSDLSEDAVDASKKVMLDTVGAMVAGAKESSTQNLMRQLADENKGKYYVLGTNETFNLQTAGLMNGVAAVAVELDEGNQWSKGHPAAHVVPTMLTYVQSKEKYSGKEFILNLVKSYEACSRFGRATTLLPDSHAHGTWGVMGAAASALFFETTSLDLLYEGINISASFAMPTMWNAALEGALIRNIYVGQAIESGIKTVDLVKSDFLAPKDTIEYVYGKVVGRNFYTEVFGETFNQWDIERNYYKEHAFCRYAHAPLDAFKMVVDENNIEPHHIDKIDVSTYSRAATLNSSEYHNALSAKFSIPYALAVWVHTKKSDHSIFNDTYLRDETIRDVARTINVFSSRELEKDYPTVMPAEVAVKLKSGVTFTQKLDNAENGLGEDVTFDDLINKFKSNTSHLPTVRQKEIIDWIHNMDEKEDMFELITLLSS